MVLLSVSWAKRGNCRWAVSGCGRNSMRSDIRGDSIGEEFLFGQDLGDFLSS